MKSMGKCVCSRPYCKATFEVFEHDLQYVGDECVWPELCGICRTQVQSVSWETKTYEGDRFDGTPHEFRYKINKYY